MASSFAPCGLISCAAQWHWVTPLQPLGQPHWRGDRFCLQIPAQARAGPNWGPYRRHRGVGESRRMETFSLPSCPKFCRNSARWLSHSDPTVSPQWATGSGRIKGWQKQAPHCYKGGWTSSEAAQQLLLSISCFPWEQYFGDSSTFWTVFLVAFSRRRGLFYEKT